jgi:hypothetical protein
MIDVGKSEHSSARDSQTQLALKADHSGLLIRRGQMKQDVRAVSVVCGGRSCDAAKALKGKRRLMLQAMALPLKDCTMSATCKCRYQRYGDRREDDDRRTPGSTARAAMYGIKERRGDSGRRPADR